MGASPPNPGLAAPAEMLLNAAAGLAGHVFYFRDLAVLPAVGYQVQFWYYTRH